MLKTPIQIALLSCVALSAFNCMTAPPSPSERLVTITVTPSVAVARTIHGSWERYAEPLLDERVRPFTVDGQATVDPSRALSATSITLASGHRLERRGARLAMDDGSREFEVQNNALIVWSAYDSWRVEIAGLHASEQRSWLGNALLDVASGEGLLIPEVDQALGVGQCVTKVFKIGGVVATPVFIALDIGLAVWNFQNARECRRMMAACYDFCKAFGDASELCGDATYTLEKVEKACDGAALTCKCKFKRTPIEDDDVGDEPAADEPVTDPPVTDEPVTDPPVTDEPVTDEPELGAPTMN